MKSIQSVENTGVRGHVRSLLAAALIVVTGLTIPGCQTAPTNQEITEQFDDYHKRLEREYERRKANCNGNPACLAEVEEWYQEQWDDLEEGLREAHKKNWEDARERRRRFEERLWDTVPKIKDIDLTLPSLIMGKLITYDITIGNTSCDEVVSTLAAFDPDYHLIDLSQDRALFDVVDESPCFDVVRISGGRLAASPRGGQTMGMNGTMSIDLGSSVINATVSGGVSLDADNMAQVPTWNVESGTLIVRVGSTQIARMEVISDSDSVVVLDSNGDGELHVLFGTTYEHEEWDAVLPYYNVVKIPVSQNAAGEFILQSGWISTSDLVPHLPWPHSDYNGDDVLDYTSDYAAFLVDFNLEHPNTDQNNDGVWDQDDIDIWTARFWDDFNAQ